MKLYSKKGIIFNYRTRQNQKPKSSDMYCQGFYYTIVLLIVINHYFLHNSQPIHLFILTGETPTRLGVITLF